MSEGASRRLSIRLLAIAVAVVFVSGGIVAWCLSRDAELEIRIRDAVSRQWVWDATAVVQAREMRVYYQSDQGLTPLTFRRLAPGDAILQISAPSYASVSVPIRLSRGGNSVEQPIELVGQEIPGLNRWVVFQEWVGSRLVAELRPLNSAGQAIVNHPCLDLWVGARVSVQEGVAPGGGTRRRGQELYAGEIAWDWDPTPETIFRYSASIPEGRIRRTSESRWVIDYLIAVPNPRRISGVELSAIMATALDGPAGTLANRLVPLRDDDRFSIYTYTSWEVDGGAQ